MGNIVSASCGECQFCQTSLDGQRSHDISCRRGFISRKVLKFDEHMKGQKGSEVASAADGAPGLFVCFTRLRHLEAVLPQMVRSNCPGRLSIKALNYTNSSEPLSLRVTNRAGGPVCPSSWEARLIHY